MSVPNQKQGHQQVSRTDDLRSGRVWVELFALLIGVVSVVSMNHGNLMMGITTDYISSDL